MKMFALLAVLHFNSGIDQIDVIDYNLTGEDCIEELIKATATADINTEYMCEILRNAPIDAE